MPGLAKTFSDINYWSSCWKHNFTSLEILHEGIWGNTSACNQLQSKVTSAFHKAFCIAHWKACVLFSIKPMSQRLFLNAFNGEELFHKQCSAHMFALALVHVWCSSIPECASLPERSRMWWVYKLRGWMERMRSRWVRKGKARLTQFLLMHSFCDDLF